MTPLAAGEISFDVALVPPVLLGNLWLARHIAPMSDFVSSSFLDGFAAVTLAGAARDGAVWGLPDTAGFHLLLFYNRELVDTPPVTLLGLEELAQSLAGGSRQGLGVNSYDPLWVVPWLEPYGSWLTDAAGRPTLNTAAMEASLQLVQDWHHGPAGIAPTATYDEMLKQFLDGDVAMMINGDWAVAELNRAGQIDWGLARLPEVAQADGGQPAAPLVLARYWAISRSATENRALAAAAFLEFVTRPERQLNWTTRFDSLPTRREALDDPLIVNNPTRRISAAQMQAGRAILPGVNANTLLDAMREPLRGVIDGELTPQQAAEMMQANVGQ
jgi:ABC-type glycerol-3-phosphate transport system substrate-binding protein